jgi:5'-nucleotidase
MKYSKSRTKVLVTNDDGFDAPGIKVLADVLERDFDVTVIAPKTNQSYVSHKITVGSKLQLVEQRTGRYILDGSPADCVRVGLSVTVPDAALVFSGVNAGANLGSDVFYSGTVAAVREGVLAGRPGIAVSQYHRQGSSMNWSEVTERLQHALNSSLVIEIKPGEFLNINLPHPCEHRDLYEVVERELDFSPHDIRFSYEGGTLVPCGVFSQRQRTMNGDIAGCLDEEKIVVSRLRLGTVALASGKA